MKAIKGIILFCFLFVAVSGCFEAPIFSVLPEITFNKIQFKDLPGPATNDSLILYLDFKDGDGDLGVNADYLEEPFNASFYFLADGLGDTTKVATGVVYDASDVPYIRLKSAGLPGKLVTNRTRDEPLYNYLPFYDNASCLFYADDQLLVPATAVDNSYNIADSGFIGGDKYYLIEAEPLLYKTNVNHTNIDVTFYYNRTGSFEKFDWLEAYCFRFDARFPVLSNKTGPLEGTIRYAMASSGFTQTFSIAPLKLEIVIRDRALHLSDTIITPQFTLEGIRVN